MTQASNESPLDLPLREHIARAYRRGALAEAERLGLQLCRERPDDFDTLTLLGIIAARSGRGDEALTRFQDAARVRPADPAAHNNLGNILAQLGQAQAALDAYQQAIGLEAGFADAHNNRGNTLRALGRDAEALQSYDDAVSRRPDFAAAWNNRASVLRDLQRFDEALASYERALDLQPAFADAHAGRGAVLAAQLQHDAALRAFDQALAIQGGHVPALVGRAAALAKQNRFEEALASLDRAIAVAPGQADLHDNRGYLLRALQRFDAALASHERALALRPGHAETLNHLGIALNELRRPADAIASFTRALALQPDFADALNNRGYALRELGRLPEAIADFTRALALKPQFPGLLGSLVQAQMQTCDWRDAPALLARMEREVLAGSDVAFPFNVLALSGSAAAQRQAAQSYVRSRFAASDALGPLPPYRHERLRIGYFSADFHNHATTYLLADLLEAHDKSRFDIYGFSFGPPINDDMRRRVAAACSQFIDVRLKADADIARLTRQLEIDIAVDLKGFTQDCRPGIFALRAAPVQVNYLGYPGTMAAPYIDYLIADPVLIPLEDQAHYSEKIVALPDSYQPNDRRRRVAEHTAGRAECGLPEGFVFCCFNNSYKITPPMFERWMRILAQVDGSVLWLLEDNPWATASLQREATAHGVAADRLRFAPRLTAAQHLARHRLADLFLDTLPCNAHTTASDALWAGVPVLTCTGTAFAGRVAASLLTAVGLPELIVSDPDDYEALAVELARDPRRLAAIRARLIANRGSAALFDTPRYARHLEFAYTRMVERARAGLPPEHIEVPRMSR